MCTGNEAVEGVFVQQMVEHGQLLFPVENGNVPMYKPPLFHWTAVAIDRLAGIRKVTAANLRLPSALYAIAGAVLTMLLAYEVLGLDAAVLAGLALAASYQYISQGRFGRVDMTLCFFESLALFAFLWWLPRDPASSGPAARFESKLPALYLMAAALGLGVLAKGPVGAILPVAAILIFMIVERRSRQILTMLDPGAIILGAAIASSWYLACYFGGRLAFLNRQLDTENVGRFVGSLGAMAPWYYLKPVLFNSAPLSLLIPVAAVYALRTSLATSRNRGFYFRSRQRPLRRPPLRDLLLRHRHLLQYRRLQAPRIFAARMAGLGGDSRMVDRHDTAAGVAPCRDLDVCRVMRRPRRFQLHLYTARRSALMRR